MVEQLAQWECHNGCTRKFSEVIGKEGEVVGLSCILWSVLIDDGDDQVVSMWVRIKGKVNKEDVLVGVCCRPPYPDEKAH